MTSSEPLLSSIVRSGNATLFIDVREAKNGKKYLSIAESRIQGDERKRTTLRVFSEAAAQFGEAVEKAARMVVVE